MSLFGSLPTIQYVSHMGNGVPCGPGYARVGSARGKAAQWEAGGWLITVDPEKTCALEALGKRTPPTERPVRMESGTASVCTGYLIACAHAVYLNYVGLYMYSK
ncbi:hypothetical protein RRF57_012700 [Xylaria bambusicola]|uniref:Uncharacterized protein n=1 Tax=Xylaria bambusicola TaxID=326684 RepID=A0AAN7UX04_9PEZI